MRLRAHHGFVVIFLAGLGLGLWLQHRWPLGRILDEIGRVPSPATRTVTDLARLRPARRLVLVCVGQSNAANYGESRRAAGANVFAFAQGRIYEAIDPLVGGDGYGGSIWTRLGARLMLTRGYDAIVLAVVAEGSTSAVDWAEGGRCHARLADTVQSLVNAGLWPDCILWQQGEQEGRAAGASGIAYAEALASIRTTCHRRAPDTWFVPARATLVDMPAANEQIRLAQAAAATMPRSAPGPDLDQLGAAFRRDGIHFNDRGLEAAADRWLECLRPLLAGKLADSSNP